ncbi:MAG: hypothetical protein M3179_06490 [Actinomycetota bacterium]|nr:hypothetical protein [Actinomycetota bacterium]
MLIGLDLDGVVCDLGPSVAARITARFGVITHPSAWRTYDLRRLRLGVPEARFQAFLDETFADPSLYEAARVTSGAVLGVAQLVHAGWRVLGITARPPHLVRVTADWLAFHGIPVETVHHTPVGTKAEVAAHAGVDVAVEDNPHEAEMLGEVCHSWLFDQPYNRDAVLARARRLHSWDDLVGRLCQLRLFA